MESAWGHKTRACYNWDVHWGSLGLWSMLLGTTLLPLNHISDHWPFQRAPAPLPWRLCSGCFLFEMYPSCFLLVVRHELLWPSPSRLPSTPRSKAISISSNKSPLLPTGIMQFIFWTPQVFSNNSQWFFSCISMEKQESWGVPVVAQQ